MAIRQKKRIENLQEEITVLRNIILEQSSFIHSMEKKALMKEREADAIRVRNRTDSATKIYRQPDCRGEDRRSVFDQ
jgi:hypothetical protein